MSFGGYSRVVIGIGAASSDRQYCGELDPLQRAARVLAFVVGAGVWRLACWDAGFSGRRREGGGRGWCRKVKWPR
jgi:hypothetical protein